MGGCILPPADPPADGAGTGKETRQTEMPAGLGSNRPRKGSAYAPSTDACTASSSIRRARCGTDGATAKEGGGRGGQGETMPGGRERPRQVGEMGRERKRKYGRGLEMGVAFDVFGPEERDAAPEVGVSTVASKGASMGASVNAAAGADIGTGIVTGTGAAVGVGAGAGTGAGTGTGSGAGVDASAGAGAHAGAKAGRERAADAGALELGLDKLGEAEALPGVGSSGPVKCRECKKVCTSWFDLLAHCKKEHNFRGGLGKCRTQD